MTELSSEQRRPDLVSNPPLSKLRQAARLVVAVVTLLGAALVWGLPATQAGALGSGAGQPSPPPALAAGAAWQDGTPAYESHFDCTGQNLYVRDTAVTLGYQPGQRTGTAFWARILIQTSTASGCAGGAPISTGVIFPSGMGLALGTGNQIFTQCFDNGIAVSDSTSCPVTATAFGPDPTFWNMGLRTVTFGHTYEVRFAVRANSALTGQAMTGKAVDQTVLGSPSAYQFTVATYVNAAPNPGYTSLVPVRLLDTRAGLGAPAAAVAPGATVNLQVAGRGGVPSSGAGAVALNVTVAGPTGRGYLTVYPTGSGRPVASNLNFTAGQTIPNMVITRLGTSGMVTIYNGSSRTVHVLADAMGAFSP